jgi:hypothetical protein
MAVALAQPHRRGNRDPFLESPLGRFVLAQELPRIVYDSALDYAALVRRSFAVAGIPQPLSTGVHATREGEMTVEAARALQNQLQQVDKRLRGKRPRLSAFRNRNELKSPMVLRVWVGDCRSV